MGTVPVRYLTLTGRYGTVSTGTVLSILGRYRHGTGSVPEVPVPAKVFQIDLTSCNISYFSDVN